MESSMLKMVKPLKITNGTPEVLPFSSSMVVTAEDEMGQSPIPNLQRFKSQNPDKVYPSNLGARWTEEEEAQLLEELSKNIDFEIIAQTHNRTVGGIHSRQREIAYNMHVKNIPMDEIIEKTKLDSISILHTIDKKQNNKPKKIAETKQVKNTNTVENEIAEMKNEIKELKNTVKELVNIMKSVIFEKE